MVSPIPFPRPPISLPPIKADDGAVRLSSRSGATRCAPPSKSSSGEDLVAGGFQGSGSPAAKLESFAHAAFKRKSTTSQAAFQIGMLRLARSQVEARTVIADHDVNVIR